MTNTLAGAFAGGSVGAGAAASVVPVLRLTE